MPSNLKRLPVLPQLPHDTGEPFTWPAFPLPVPLPPSGSSADPEATPGGGGGDASDVGDPATEHGGSPLHTPGDGTGSTSGEGASPSGGAGDVSAASWCCLARIALSRPAAAFARVLRGMPGESEGQRGGEGGEAQNEPLSRASQRIVPTNGHFVLRTLCFALCAS